MKEKSEVWQGTLALMVLKSLEAMGPQHGYGIARRIEQISEDLLSINQGTLYPVLLKLEAGGYDLCGVGHLGQQPKGEVLPPHEEGQEAVGVRCPPVATDHRHHRPVFRLA
jgi:hypothetical protein